MKTYKVAELEGALLDLAVAQCEGMSVDLYRGHCYHLDRYTGLVYAPHLNWRDAGPIIEREKLMLEPKLQNGIWNGVWRSVCLSWEDRTHSDMEADTPLVAAMRCYVRATLGGACDTVELPE